MLFPMLVECLILIISNQLISKHQIAAYSQWVIFAFLINLVHTNKFKSGFSFWQMQSEKYISKYR